MKAKRVAILESRLRAQVADLVTQRDALGLTQEFLQLLAKTRSSLRSARSRPRRCASTK